MTSPPLHEASICQTPIWVPGATTQIEPPGRVTPVGKPVAGLKFQELIESLTNRTDPSQNPTFTPPGWKLEALFTKAPAWSFPAKFAAFF